jgi:DNA-binding Xre family transcriptional regulator
MASNKDLNRLKVILAEKKKSNLWLSRQLGCAPTTVSKWCTNSSQPPLEMLMKITVLLDVELKDLVRYDELYKNEE